MRGLLLLATAVCASLGASMYAVAADQQDEFLRHLRRANDFLDKSDPEHAIEPAGRALELAERTFGAESEAAALCLTQLAEAHGALRHYPETAEFAGRAVTILERLPDRDSAQLSANLDRLGRAHHFMGHFEDAERAYSMCLPLLESAYGRRSRVLAEVQGLYADVQSTRGKTAEATRSYRRALNLLDSLPVPDSTAFLRVVNNYYKLCNRAGTLALLEPDAPRLLEIGAGVYGRNTAGEARVLASVAVIYADVGRYAESERLGLRALAILEKALGPEDTEVVGGRELLAALYRRIGRFEEAEAVVGPEPTRR